MYNSPTMDLKWMLPRLCTKYLSPTRDLKWLLPRLCAKYLSRALQEILITIEYRKTIFLVTTHHRDEMDAPHALHEILITHHGNAMNAPTMELLGIHHGDTMDAPHALQEILTVKRHISSSKSIHLSLIKNAYST